MSRINIVPLSVNKAWQGRKWKTPEYKRFERDCLLMLPKIKVPEPPFRIEYHFGFSNKLSDLLNPEKLVTDILCKKYGINDRDVFEMSLKKEITPKGKEYIEFEITHC
jgi:hypothetical protein